MRILSYLLFAALIVALAASMVIPVLSSAKTEESEEEPTCKYVGAAGCKFCHQKRKGEEVYETWESSNHAKAFERLGEKHRDDDVCLACHTTGFGKPIAAGVTAKMLRGVQCEACHGPGSCYKKIRLMKDRDTAMKMGLIEPTEKVCKGCHIANLPKECWAGAEEGPRFNFQAARRKITHGSLATRNE